MKIANTLVLISTVLFLIHTCLATPTTDTFMNEKAKYLNTKDWGKFKDTEGNFFIILDGNPYMVQVKDGKIAEVKAGTPNTYDYKIETDTKTANRWWSVATYYLENGKFKWRHILWDIPYLRLHTQIYHHGHGGNIAYAIANIKDNILICIK